MEILDHSTVHDHDRSDDFLQYARRRAEGAVLVPPELLEGQARRRHVRRTLREDHRFRLHNRPEGARRKFDKLSGNLFSFFRGTALLYYRDQAGRDADLPVVFTIGDVHPENFGVMPNRDGAPIFGVNDFDEAAFAPFTWDLRRGALGFWLSARENDLSKKKRRKIVRAFIDGYVDALISFAKDDREKTHQFRIDNSPKMIRKLLEGSKESRCEFLEDTVDLDRSRFRSSEEIVPLTHRCKDFQEILEAYVEATDTLDPGETLAPDFFTVKDVAIKKGSGTASLGLDRFWVLVEGRSDAPGDDVILELKQARTSALEGLAPPLDGEKSRSEDDPAATVAKAQAVHLAGGDPFYGCATVDDRSFLVRERSPLKDDIDVDDLGKKELKRYARICGRALAQTHARSDEDTGIQEGDAEAEILAAISHRKLFREDFVRDAEEEARRMKRDFEMFREDHEHAAFDLRHESG